MIISTKPSSGAGLKATIDTRANILALDPSIKQIAFATDTLKFYITDGTGWREAPIPMLVRSALPNMGVEQNSSLQGYELTSITDKDLYNCQIKGNANSSEGAIKTVLATTTDLAYPAIYLNAVWNNIVMNLNMREVGGVLQIKPVGYTEWLWAHNGNSVTLGLNGLPLIQGYKASMGAYPVPLVVDGGTF